MAPPARSNAGFTLIEILIAVTLLGVVMLGLGSATFLAYRTVDTTSNSLLSSTDAQLLSSYLPADIKSADVGTTSVTCTGTTLPKLKLTSNAYATGGVAAALVVVYWVQTVTLATTPVTYRYQLVRSICTTGTKASDVVVVRNLSLTTSVTVTALSTPSGYKMAITEKKSPRDSANYVYSVAGRFRTGILS